jgi:uncharacterized membrane protein
VSRYNHPPLAWLFVFWFGVALAALVVLVQLDILTLAFAKIGVTKGWLFAVLIGSFVGSFINIPLTHVASRANAQRSRIVTVHGMKYLVPANPHPLHTTLAVNVGGALIPIAVAGYLIVHDHLGWPALIAVAAVTLFVHAAARPVRGVGIVVPGLLPPLVAAGCALLLSSTQAPALAYVAGTLGCLLGADILNLDKIRELDAPIASIGGAGTFDGIFLTGIVAVLIAGL